MQRLVAHFGETRHGAGETRHSVGETRHRAGETRGGAGEARSSADGGGACGHCDVCAPRESIALELREPSLAEREAMSQVLKSLSARNGQSTGRLHVEASGGGLERNDFEALLAALVRAGLLRVEEDEFESEGERIRFRRAYLTPAARDADEAELAAVSVVERTRSRGGAARSGRGRTATTRRKAGASPARSRKRRAAPRAGSAAAGASEGRAPLPAVVEALKAWRLGVAKRRRMPAFKVLNDRTLEALAAALPGDEEQLLAVKGIGPTLVRKYGTDLLDVVARHRRQ
jgi:DNA topoisomerase-3